jgi:hypothetical protein
MKTTKRQAFATIRLHSRRSVLHDLERETWSTDDLSSHFPGCVRSPGDRRVPPR